MFEFDHPRGVDHPRAFPDRSDLPSDQHPCESLVNLADVAHRSDASGARTSAGEGEFSRSSFRCGADQRTVSMAMYLQRSAGNRAVANALGPPPGAPSTAPASAPTGQPMVMRQPTGADECSTQDAPPAPAQDLPDFDNSMMSGSEPKRAVLIYIRQRPAAGPRDMGVTAQPDITDYSVPGVRFIPTRGADGRWSAQVTRSWLPGRPHIESFSPSPGVHKLPSPAGTGGSEYLYLGEGVANRVDEGEREHVGDHLYAWQAVTSILDGAISQLMLLRPPTAPSQRQAIECSKAWLRSALPPRLRWPRGDIALSMGMIQALTSLSTATGRRDSSGWHSFPSRAMVDWEKRKLGIPVGASAREILDKGHEVGSHPTEELIKSRWATLPRLD